MADEKPPQLTMVPANLVPKTTQDVAQLAYFLAGDALANASNVIAAFRMILEVPAVKESPIRDALKGYIDDLEKRQRATIEALQNINRSLRNEPS